MNPGALIGGANHSVYVVLERICLTGIALLWRPPWERTFSRSLALGLTLAGGTSSRRRARHTSSKGAFTVSCNLPWKECVDLVGSQEAVVFWHHWPDEIQ